MNLSNLILFTEGLSLQQPEPSEGMLSEWNNCCVLRTSASSATSQTRVECVCVLQWYIGIDYLTLWAFFEVTHLVEMLCRIKQFPAACAAGGH